MRALTTVAVVGPDHRLTARVPPDVAPGPKTVVIVLDERAAAGPKTTSLRFTPYPVGLVDPGFTFRREDLYGDDGR
jgi:hypothetical protein